MLVKCYCLTTRCQQIFSGEKEIMALNTTNLFADIGEHVLAIEGIESSMATMIAFRDAIVAQYESSSNDAFIGNVFIEFDQIIAQLDTQTQRQVDLITQRLLDRDTVLEELPTLISTDINSVIVALTEYMIDNSQTINQSAVTVGSVTKSTTNTNTGSLITTQKLPGDTEPGSGLNRNRNMFGVTSQFSLDDSVEIRCTSDSQEGSTEGAETFSITGKLPQANLPFEYNQGGNKSVGNITVSPGASLVDAMFEDFTSDLPDGWTASGGVAGTDFGAEATEVMTGSNSLYIDPTGGGTTDLRLDIYDILVPGQIISFQLWLKKAASATGNLIMDCEINGSSVASETIDVSTLSTSAWTLHDIVVEVPLNIGDDDGTSFLQILDSTLATANVYIDNGAFTPFTYWGGVGFAIAQGDDKFLIDDKFTFTLANNDAGKFQRLFTRAYGHQLPSSGSPTISDPS